MKVFNGIEAYPRDDGPVVATLGNYDGIHLGHRAILDGVRNSARRRGLPSLLITFEPHPLTVVAPDRRPQLLLTRGQKVDAVADAGIDRLLFLAFDEEVARLSGAAFFEEHLSGPIELAGVHVGTNFRFGQRRAGTLETLVDIGRKLGFDVEGIAPVEVDGQVVSSSAIRRLIDEGRVEDAGRLLGRPFALSAVVVRGEGRGRSLDFPTANLDVANECLPRRGVYVTEWVSDAVRRASVTNVGVRPTFDGERLVVETHVLDFDEDVYDRRVELAFLARLRDEHRFDGPAALADQIARDRAAAAAYFENVSLTGR